MEKSIQENEFSARVEESDNIAEMKSIVLENEKFTFNSRLSVAKWFVKWMLLPSLIIVSILTEHAFVFTSVLDITGLAIAAWIASAVFIVIVEGIKIRLGYVWVKFISNAWLREKGNHYKYAFGLITIVLSGALFASVTCSVKGIPIAFEIAAEWVYNPKNEQLEEIDRQIADARATKWKGTTTNESTKAITTLSEQRASIVEHMLIDKNRFKERVKSIGTSFKAFGGGGEAMTILALLFLATFNRYSYIEMPEDEKEKIRKISGIQPVKKN